MEKKRKLTFIAAIVGIIGSFLPWISHPFFGSVGGLEGDGKITLILFAIAGALVFFAGNKAEPLKKGLSLVVWIAAGIAAVVGLIDLSNINETGFSVGIGLWLVVIAGIAVVVNTLFLKGSKVEGTVYAPPSPPAPKPAPEPAAPEPAAPEPAAPEPEPEPEPEEDDRE